MSTGTTLSFDHTHLISPDPQAAADWYVEKLGGSVVKSAEVRGAPQIYVEFADGAMVVVRG